MTIQNARSNTSGNAPVSLQDGQIAINQADDVLFTRKPNGSTRSFLLPKRRGIADTLITIGTAETYIGIASLTTSRAVMLPLAASYPVGHALSVVDEAGALSPTVTLTLTPQGIDKVNGVSSLALATAFTNVQLYSDGVSKWTVSGLPAGIASNSVLYVAQSLTGGQQDQARLNLSGATAASQTATTTLAAVDLNRDQFVTGTSTLTMPTSVAPGWRSGVVTNDNAITGLVTLAVPSGHSLDGVTNGSTILYPFQRASLQLVQAGVWRTNWADRTPVIYASTLTTAVASLDINLPVGFSKFRIDISGLSMSVAGGTLCARFSDSGSAGIKVGVSDYITERQTASSAVAASATPDAFGYVVSNINDNGGATRPVAMAVLNPGAPGQSPIMVGQAYLRDNTPTRVLYGFGIDYVGSTSGAIGRANLIRLLASTGNINPGTAITVWGES